MKVNHCWISGTAIRNILFLSMLFLFSIVHTSEAEEIAATLRIAGFETYTDAAKAVRDLRSSGIPGRVMAESDRQSFYVEIGRYHRSIDLFRMQRKLREKGYHNLEMRIADRPPLRARLIKDWGEIDDSLKMSSEEFATGRKVAKDEPDQLLLVEDDPSTSSETIRNTDTKAKKEYGIKLSNAAVEVGVPFQNIPRASTINYLRGEALAFRQFGRWEITLSGRFDAHLQTGTRGYTDAKLDYGESFLRYRGPSYSLTIGAQKVMWGRLDFLPPNDLLSTRDFSRIVADELRDQRRPSFAIRLENFLGSFKLDTLVIPFFRSAVVPELGSAWSPIDRYSGRVLTGPNNPLMNEIARQGQIEDRDSGFGGAGIRLSHIGDGFDYGMTLQRGRHSLPHYEINHSLLAATFSGVDPALSVASIREPAMIGLHPLTWSLGADAGFSVADGVLRIEAAWLSDVPVTRADNFLMETVQSFNWGVGYEFYPGDANLRMNVQLMNRFLNLGEFEVMEDEMVWVINGEIENIHARNRWRERLRFNIGVAPYDLYLNPEVAYIGLENNEFFVGMRIFEGDIGTLGHAFDDHDLITAGWRLRY